MGEADTGPEQGGGRYSDPGTDTVGGVAVGSVVQIKNMGDDAAHQEGVGRIPPQGVPQVDRESTLER